MKRYLLLLIICISFLTPVRADNILLLTNPKSKETNVFRTGSYLVFQLKADNSMHEGFIRDINDSSIVFDDSEVSLSQIKIFAGSTKSKIAARRVANAVGNTLLFAGTTVFDCGASLIMYNDYYYWPLGGTIWLTGAFISGIGYAFGAISPHERTVRVRNYRQWNASIVRDDQPQINEKQNVQKPDSRDSSPTPEKQEKEKKKNSKNDDDVYGN